MILFIAALLVLALAVAILRTVAHDGYGTRPAPRSHVADDFAPQPWR